MTTPAAHPAGQLSDLLDLTPGELAARYSSGAASEIPHGRAKGTALILPGGRLARPLATLTRVLAWQGKTFDPETKTLVNRVTPFGIKGIRARVYVGASLFDDQPAVVLDYSKTSWLAWFVRDEIREVRPGLYLGYAYGFGVRWIAFALDFTTQREATSLTLEP